MSGYTGIIANVAVRILVIIVFVPTRAPASDFFHVGPLKYFSEGEKIMRQGFKQVRKIIDWREPVLSQDGTITYHVPPRPVLDLLDDPTQENARLYLAWQNEKMQRILKAQEVLAETQKQEQRR